VKGEGTRHGFAVALCCGAAERDKKRQILFEMRDLFPRPHAFLAYVKRLVVFFNNVSVQISLWNTSCAAGQG
jgi:hypothetical protein